MTFIYNCLFVAMWLGYRAYWSAMSASVKATERLEPASSRLARLVLMARAIALLCLPRLPLPLLDERFLPRGTRTFWSGAAITACGLLFSVRARRHLGSNWSQAVTLKEGHGLITSGPYALVRHRIYAGLPLAILGSAVARGEWRGFVAAALVFIALWRKLRLEERWMRELFGASYEAYSRKVALVPYIL